MIKEKHWSVLFNAQPIPTVLLKADHPVYTIVFANEAYKTLTNTHHKDIIGKSFAGLLHNHYSNIDETLNSLGQLLKDKAAQKQSAVKFEFQLPGTKSTELKYLNIFNTPLPGDDGEVEYIIRTINDITDVVAAQKKENALYEDLIKHEKFLSESQRIAHIGNWEVNMVDNSIVWSDVLKDIYEVPLDHQPTFESSLALYKDDRTREILINAVNEAVEKKGVFDVELEIITAKGNPRWVRSTGKADLKNDECIRLYGVTQDITAKKAAEKALIESSNQYQALIESVDGVVWEADANTFKFTYISNKINKILGYTSEQWLSDPNFWANHIYETDRHWAVNFCQTQTRKALNHVFDYRMLKADGGLVWIKDLVSVIAENGMPKLLRGVMIDITSSKLLSDLDNLEKNVLELVADKEQDLHGILAIYLKGIENLLPHMNCSLMQVKNNKLFVLAAPSLPKDYLAAINGLPISKQGGSCGTSAYLKAKVIVSDISTDPLCENYRHLALKHDLKACWSCPIIDSDNNVMAVFGMYYDYTKAPATMDQMVIDRSIAILKVILENRQHARLIKETTMLMIQGQELANFGNWQWDIKNNTVKWSDVLFNIYGVDKDNHVATYESYMSMLHEEDREQVQNIILGALNTKEDVVFEERIIRPNGELRHLKSWGRVLCDDDGNPEKMIGSCLDITAAKIAESQLWEIAWMQSHLVRAPLARLMGLVKILKEEQSVNGEVTKLLDYIMSSAHELDKVVKDISNKTVSEAK